MANNNFPPEQSQSEKDPLALFINQSKNWLQQYFKSILLVLVAGLLIFGLSILFSYWQRQNNRRAEERLYQARKALVLVEEKAGGEILGVDNSQNFFGQDKKAEYNTEVAKSANEYIKVIKKWISKPAALSAATEMAHFLYQYERRKEAVDLLQTARPYKKKDMIGFLIALQLGTYLMDQSEYETAIENFQFIIGDKNAKWLWPDALMRLALCYEKENKIAEAKKMYRQVKNDFSDSQAGERAVQYLNLLQLQEKIKEPTKVKATQKESKE